MNRILATLFVMLSAVLMVHGQEQSGIPAKLTAANGKEFPVFLQALDDDKIVFQLYKRPNNQAVPVRLIAKIEFVAPIDSDGAEELFGVGDYQGMITKMRGEFKPSLDDYWPFMAVENNFQDLFTMLMKAYLRTGNVSKANDAAEILLQNKNEAVKGQAESIALLAALGQDRIADAEGLLQTIKSAPGKLYLGACIERAKGHPFEAIQMITDLIAQYANDLSWMPQAELLCAHLYMDMGMTNSAINTARQVQNIYTHTDVGNDASKLHEELLLAKQQADEAAKARQDAEEAAREAVRARAEQRAKGYGFNVDEESDAGTDADVQTDMETSDETQDNDQGSGEL